MTILTPENTTPKSSELGNKFKTTHFSTKAVLFIG